MSDQQMANDHNNLNSNNIPPVAVLGGSGFIGSSLVMKLLHVGAKINLLTHHVEHDLVSPRGQLKFFEGDINNQESLEACFSGCAAVFHLVGIIAETKQNTFQKTVLEGTETVVRAAKKAGVGKVIYLSALGTNVKAQSKYHRSKYGAEQTIIKSGLDYTIFRPSVVFGPGDQFINMVAGMIRSLPLLPIIGDGLYKLQPVFLEDLTSVMVLSLSRTESSGKLYEVGGPEALTYLGIVDIIKQVLNKKRLHIHLPMGLMRLVASVLEKVLSPAPITVDQLKMMKAGSTCDHKIVEKQFGLKFTPLGKELPTYMERS